MKMQFKYERTERPSTEKGYTILEAIMAILVVSILMMAIAPVIAFSVGTRVQAKRIELATQAARTYIDGVKIGSIPAPTPSNVALTQRAAPASGTLSCDPATNLCNTTLYCVDFDGGGCSKDSNGNTSLVDMIVQGEAYHPQTTGTAQGYVLSARVYRANAFVAGIALKAPDENNAADRTTTNALGDPALPLIAINTEVAPRDDNFDSLKNRLENQYTPASP